MQAPALSFKLDDTEVTKKFGNMIKAAQDYQAPLEEAATDMLDLYGNKVFQQQGANQEAWKPLSATTLMMRENRTGYYAATPRTQGKILIWTGQLMDGFTKQVDKVKLTIENAIEYFKYQQPKRKMLYLNKDIITLVMDKVLKHTNNSMK